MTFQTYTLGCKTNRAENDLVTRHFLSRGLTYSEQNPGIVVVNTCAVTAEAERKCRALIRRLRRENPAALIAVHGCMSERLGAEMTALGADVIAGTRDREKILALADGAAITPDASAPFFRTRALLKIQDGCSNACAYCIIPNLRGGAVSVPEREIFAEAERLSRENYREIVITGTEISSYPDLCGLVAKLCAAYPRIRFRLGSLTPGVKFDAFPENLCPHFHIALQSGCEKTLKRMNRAPRRDLREYVFNLKQHGTLGCDLIVGFPGETDADFRESLNFVREAGFAFVHVFPFSAREGTPAAGMEQLPPAAIRERAKIAGEQKRELYETAWANMRGKTVSVLFESERGGHCGEYFYVEAPGVRGEVREVQIK